MDNELGGFAEEPEYVSDAYTEEEQRYDFECFNYCLAEEYAGAMYAEDFESIGEVDSYLFDNICNWINYDEELGNEDLKKQIETGTLITKQGRTFLDAIVANRNINFGELYTAMGVYNARVIVMLIEQAGLGLSVVPIQLKIGAQEELDELYSHICERIEERFKEENESMEYLKIIKNGMSTMYFPKKLNVPPIPNNLTWTRHLKRTVSK